MGVKVSLTRRRKDAVGVILISTILGKLLIITVFTIF